MTTWRRAGSRCPSSTSRERGIISAERRLGLSLEIHEVRVQPLLRGGKMVQEDAALPVETSAFHDHAGQKPETSEIETAGSYQKSELAAGHHRALAAGVHGRRFTRPR
jgi:hypothetical protein